MTSNTLKACILLWKAGARVPVDLIVTLTNQGFDVPALERQYSI